MPFEDLETVTKENEAPTATLSYLRHTRKDNPGARARVTPKLTITVPTKIFITTKERFRLQVGTGSDKGRMRIIGVAKGVPGAVGRGADFKNHVKLKFGFVPRLGDDAFDGMKCPFVRIEQDVYELKIEDEILFAATEEARTGNVRKIANG
jgi:hypothetical protein